MFNQYQPNLENMQQYLNQENEKSSGEGTKWWSIPAGMSSIRILPPWDPSGRVALPVYMHPIEYKGKDMSYTKYNWTCVNKTFSKPCPICEGLKTLADSGVDTSNWEANRRQYYFNAIVMHDPTYNQAQNKGTAPGTHVLMRAPKTFYDWVIAQITNPMIGDITSTTNGIDVYITKEGQGLGTTYSMTLSPNGRTPIPPEYLEKITALYNLDEIFSAGFEAEQVNDLISSLQRSAGSIGGMVGSVSNQMAGYGQQQDSAQLQGTPINPVPYTPNPYAGTPTSIGDNNSVSVTPITPAAPSTAPVQPSVAPAVTPPSNSSEGLPKCYGNYDAGNVNCVVCPHEIECSQKK